MIRCRASSAVMCVMLAATLPMASGAQAGSVRSRPAPSLEPGSATAGTCTVREVSREPLVVDRAREMYVEPVVVQPSGNRVLLAGTPNYLFQPGFPGMARDFVRDTAFGAVLEPDGSAHLVPAPSQVDSRLIADPRALPLSGGGWEVVFAELKIPSDPQYQDTVVAYWYGVFDGRAWNSVERLPRPAEGLMEPNASSDLVQRGDTTAFAVPIGTSNGRDVAIFERRAGQWSLDVLPTRRGAYPRLTFSDSLGMLLFLVRPDTTMRRDINSAFIYAKDPSWRALRKLLPGSPEPVHNPVVSRSSSGPVLTWMVRFDGGGNRARAAIGPTERAITEVIALDSDVVHIATVRGFEGPPFWVADRVNAEGSREMRFVTTSGSTAVVAATGPAAYTGYFSATGIGASEILVSGPLFRSAPPNPSLVTLLIRSRVECRPRAP